METVAEWEFLSEEKVTVYVNIKKDQQYFAMIRTEHEFKFAQGSNSMTHMLLFIGKYLQVLRQQGLLSVNGESFLHRCMESVKV